MVDAMSRSPYPRERAAVPMVEEARWATRPFWTEMERKQPLSFTGFRIPDISTRAK